MARLLRASTRSMRVSVTSIFILHRDSLSQIKNVNALWYKPVVIAGVADIFK